MGGVLACSGGGALGALGSSVALPRDGGRGALGRVRIAALKRSRGSTLDEVRWGSPSTNPLGRRIMLRGASIYLLRTLK